MSNQTSTFDLILVLACGFLQALNASAQDFTESRISSVDFETIPTNFTFVSGWITLNGNTDVNGELFASSFITSDQGGFRFPDGTIQTSAYLGSTSVDPGYLPASSGSTYVNSPFFADLIDGRIGLGTDSPTAPLTISSPWAGESIRIVSDAAGSRLLWARSDGSAEAGLATDGLGSLSVSAGGYERVTVKPDGRVIIGQEPPLGGEPLSVTGLGSNGAVRLTNNSSGHRIFWTRSDNSHETGIMSDGWSGFLIRTGGVDRVAIGATGNLGIGELSPAYKLMVNGEPAANGYTQFTNYSDSRLKKAIRRVEDGVLGGILNLKPSSFSYLEPTGYASALLGTRFFGFTAQELREVFPHMVGQSEIGGVPYLDSNLSSLPVLLVKAIQEQQQIIVNSTDQLQGLKAELNEKEARIEKLEKQVEALAEAIAGLRTLAAEGS